MSNKLFVVDTNVFLSDCDCLEDFAEENEVVIPFKVLDEIDDHKERQDSVGANARGIIRKLDDLREKGDLSDGVKFRNGKVRVAGYKDVLPEDFDMSDEDNQIIAVARTEQQNNPNKHVTLISRDLNLRVKCNSLGIKCEDYTDIKVLPDSASLYKGHQEEVVSREIINKCHDVVTDGIHEDDIESNLRPNEFINLQSAEGNGTALLRNVPGQPMLMKVSTSLSAWKVSARNREQIYSFDLLMDSDVDIVTLAGRAGAGKTLLATCAGLSQVLEAEEYGKLVIVCPVEPVGRDLGYLPGTMEEKIHPWLKPFKDQLEEIVGDRTALEEYMDFGKIEIEPLSYIRGRTLNDAFICLDSAQNLSLHETRTVMTRVGNGSKIALTGDIQQIDNAYVDETSNGLTHVVEKFKKDPIAGHCTLMKGERSKVASAAAEAL